jgi:hypothetical protein
MQQKLTVAAGAIAQLLIALAVLTLGSPAWAEASRFQSDSVIVIDANDLLNERGDIVKNYGDTLQLTLSGTPLSQAFARHPFEVRIYRLNNDGSGPFSLNGFNPCLVYYGAVYPLSPQGSVLTISTFDRIEWFNIDGAGRLSPGRFLMVFQSLTDDHGLFRLNLQKGLSAQRYFKLGRKLTIQPPQLPASQVAAYVAEYRAGEAGRSADAAANSPDLTCFQARQEVVAAGKVTFLEACAVERRGHAPPASAG